MLQVFTKDNISEIEQYLNQDIYSNFSVYTFLNSQADYHIISVDNNNVNARCSVWITNAPPGTDGSKVGTIGHYAVLGENCSLVVLEKACNILREHNCKSAIGPMDGNTWRRYRFVTYSDGSSPFLLEPQNPPEYPIWFEKSGFKPTSQYFSKRSQLPNNFDSQQKLLSDLRSQDITIRPLDMSKLDSELDIIYDISAIAFSNNLYYTELDRENFKKQYLAYKDYLVPNLILLAFHKEEPIGFMFSIPDYNEAKTKGTVKTIIAKTIAVLPDYRKNHVGNAMLKESYKNAVSLGFKDVIVALVYNENVSANLIQKDFDFNRKYTLYIKNL